MSKEKLILELVKTDFQLLTEKDKEIIKDRVRELKKGDDN